MSFEPPFSSVQTATLALLAIGAAVSLAARQWRNSRRLAPLILRVFTVLCLVLLLFNPVARTYTPSSKDKPTFLILLDTSRSMNTPDEADALSRWQMAKRLTLENRALLDPLEERYSVRFAGFDNRFRPQAATALREMEKVDGSQTLIANALRQTAAIAGEVPSGGNAKQPPVRGGILLVSDGRDNGSDSPLDAARTVRGAGFPVYTLRLGKAEQDRDISVTAQRPQVWAAPNQPVELTAALYDTGISQTSAQIDLRRGGRIIQSKTVAIAPGTREVTFTVRESDPGYYRYAIACRPVSGETNPANNRASILLNVMRNRARVLLLEGLPTWDAKFLAQTLRDDPTIALDSIYQITDSRAFGLSADSARPDLRVPGTLAEFTPYDIVMVGKGFNGFFDAEAAKALKQWVSERGGNLVLLRGQAEERNEALRELEPVIFSDTETANVRARLTDAGRDYPGFAFRGSEDAQTVVQKLPSLISATQTQGEKALTVVLARAGTANSSDAADADAPEIALLAYQRYGQGKVMALAAEGIWRWAFLPPEQAQYASVYPDFWTQTVRWLISESDFLPGQNLSLKTDRAAYSLNETVNLLGFVRNVKAAKPPVITLTLPNGETASLVSAFSDGKTADFTATFRPKEPGDYLATVPPANPDGKAAPASAAFTVYPGQQEDANRSADPELMKRIAAIGGGQDLQPADLPALAEKLRAAELSAQSRTETRTLWDNGFTLAFLLALLFAQWTLRRKI